MDLTELVHNILKNNTEVMALKRRVPNEKSFWEFCAAMNMTMGNTPCKKKET